MDQNSRTIHDEPRSRRGKGELLNKKNFEIANYIDAVQNVHQFCNTT